MADPGQTPVVAPVADPEPARPDRALLAAGLIITLALLICVLMFLVAS
jgi:hypothetical protein